MPDRTEECVWRALESFHIEIPSWGFANTGTRFGKFVQAGAATSIEEKFADAAEVHQLTGACPTLALHVLWDLKDGLHGTNEITRLASKYGVQAGAINPNLFQDQQYKHGSLGNADAAIRQQAVAHLLDSVEIGKRLNSRDVSLWFADGTNYPGSSNIRHRKHWFAESLREVHTRLSPSQRLLVEYKPFEPAFYHTDIADWGMALLLARSAGPQAKVLVDTGHHYQAKTSNRLWRGCSTRKCLAGSISTIAAMRMTI